jgi:hypothetical protein
MHRKVIGGKKEMPLFVLLVYVANVTLFTYRIIDRRDLCGRHNTTTAVCVCESLSDEDFQD